MEDDAQETLEERLMDENYDFEDISSNEISDSKDFLDDDIDSEETSED